MWVWLDRDGEVAYLAVVAFSILGGSSVGVAMEADGRTEAERKSFSILGGSSVGVAATFETPHLQSPDFQYPRRIECGCGLSSHDLALRAVHRFQYPRRIECGCGSHPCAHLGKVPVPFSILGGSSVGVARATTVNRKSEAGTPFSILGGSSVGVALRSTSPGASSPLLSVSSADRVWVWLT